ncbi:uncharacterized protein TRIVIDRAFT_216619 [Trichoderma virens Gv29-8]|uniref:Uncharacterized protein n=1 Tax=Hypocrea virens (strain Gv29-8 / FGSC 10586) TaxID=413071 RepID=G9N314_HYPVG|nr:uncharacterized protein TRIVIDRAFT_216619 [Trichoderma virens Gv29-8]EHK18699.1 hypothetical protein TRIVIDRAFT_216619 [Trichoderma virens Gv29-8]
MCTRNVIEYRCKHQVFRGNTRCYRDDCPGRRDEIAYDTEDCAQCEGHKRIQSARWCPMGCSCKCVVM